MLIRYHIADKWEIYCPLLRYSAGITSHLSWGQSPNSRSSRLLLLSSARFASPPTGSFCSACSGCYCAVSVRTGVAMPVVVIVMVSRLVLRAWFLILILIFDS